MGSTWLAKARTYVYYMGLAAKFTKTTVDDEIVAGIKTAIEDANIQSLIDWVINTIHVSPELSTAGAIDKAPQHLLMAAEESYGKIGDGKIINLLIKILPILLAL